MPMLRLADGRAIGVRRASDIQLVADTDFSGSRQRPVVIDVAEVDGRPVAARLAVLDCHSIWLSHQAEIAPRSPRGPAVPTGLTAAEAVGARELFIALLGTGTLPPVPPPPPPPKPWVREALIAVAVPVVVAVILALLGLSR